ncbi:patatin-like phospholipase family protein [Paraglaciecola sp. L1A13]|uniref:patatin-like phospholipase family protein n=1 Tax=Paraglaciecola sp. L1A13 TaxID=2686359 RepID=UPI00131A801A|nr:patatin-like phospholipase family protein [Paraglaciecola sp. L1A13]|tara:strand:- start:10470 stop:11600 length:1131 start_codon:yes stop_codon:yes gene_type:complete
MHERNQYALLLSGGGARAAYQLGVLKSISTFLPRNRGIPFPIVCGSSAGAINATGLACYASCYHLGIRKLEHVWKNFTTRQVYGSGIRDVYSHLAKSYFQSFQSALNQKHPSSLLNNEPLRKLIRKKLDFKRIDNNVANGYLRAISISASSYSTHDSISYFQGHQTIQPWHRQQRRGIKTALHSEHLMASSAIPLVFPPVKLDGEFLGDGSVHQLSPLSPPIHLGAEKILVIGVEQPERAPRFTDVIHYPGGLEIAGHLLDTIFADTLRSDLERMQRINQTIAQLTPAQRQQSKLKNIDCLMINPSITFNEIAARHFHQMPSGIKSLLRIMGLHNKEDSSLLSYLIFEREYCKELIELGFNDGLTRAEEIRSFLAI